MLEAFQRSARADESRREAEAKAPKATPEPAEPTSPEPAKAAPPRAETRTRPEPAAAPKPAAGGPFDGGPALPFEGGDEVLGTGPRPSRVSPRTALVVAGVIVAMLVTFLLGRDLGRTTAAAAGDGGEAPSMLPEHPPVPSEETGADPDSHLGVPTVDPRRPARPTDMTADDRAFLDSKNNWTVVAISFDNSQTGGDLALATYHYLREQGMPAVAPLTRGDYLQICVGAEPSHNDAIERVRAELRRLPGPPPRSEKGAFESAHFANIEDLIDPALRR